jgi:nucleoporin NUP159
MGQTPPSSYYVITRRKGAPFLVQKMPELCLPFGVNRAPAYQFIARLRDYKPHLKDILIVSSTASTDLGLITRSDQPLASDDAAKGTVGLFTTTEVNDDTKRASLPLNEASSDTSVIGLGVDLSSTEPVVSPIQGEDIAESSTPLPNLFLLNNEGILCSWWIIYSESIRQKLPYPGLVSVSTQQPQPQPQALEPAKPTTGPSFGQPAFGQPAFGGPSAMGSSPFGKPSAAPAFGSPSALGSRQPTFGTPSAPSGPSFGSPSQIKPSFGAPSTLGRATPQFGQSGFGASAAPSFGQPSTPAKPLPFGAPSATSGGGFGSFANAGGFSSFAAAKPATESPFAKPAGESPFGKPAAESPFGKMSTESPFAKPSGPSVFGTQTQTDTAFTPQKADEPKTGFVLGSTFKGDGTAVNDGPKPDKASGLFSLGTALDDMISTPDKTSPPTESMDDTEDQPAVTQPEKPAAKEPLFGAPKIDTSKTTLFNAETQLQPATQTNKSPFSLFGSVAAEKQVTSPLSPLSEKTTVASLTPKAEAEPPLPPDPTSRAAYGPGDTSASSNVSKSSVEDKPLWEDVKLEAPLPPDFTNGTKDKVGKPAADEAPLPPEPAVPESPAASDEEAGPLPEESDVDESERELSEEADESDFADSGEEITHEIDEEEEEPETTGQTPKISPESSFGTAITEQSPAGGLFSRITRPGQQQPQRQLFGEIAKPMFPPKTDRELPRSPSPVRGGLHKTLMKPQIHKAASAPHVPGSTLAARKASLTEAALREQRLRQESDRTALEQEARLKVQAQRQEEEALSLSDDDEDERLRADLAQPLEPVPTLDPFLPHQDYMGGTTKPGIPGQIERLYRDINSMIDTLGINSRALSSFLLYQQSPRDSEKWIQTLKTDHPADVLDEKVLLGEIEKLDDAVLMLANSLQEQRVQRVEEKLEICRELLSKDILTLRGQCASIRKTLDAHTDSAAILSAPLSAEQANLQQDLRSAFTNLQASLADLESAVSLLRAKIAEAPRPDSSRQPTKRPTVEAVTSTIATMMNMAESKSTDIDVLEIQLKKLGIDTSGPPASREGSPFATPKKALARFPTTPGSRGSIDGPLSAYHTPESAGRFRSSINGSAKVSLLRNIEAVGELATKEETAQWKSKVLRRQHIIGNLKKVIEAKKSKVRGVDDL